MLKVHLLPRPEELQRLIPLQGGQPVDVTVLLVRRSDIVLEDGHHGPEVVLQAAYG